MTLSKTDHRLTDALFSFDLDGNVDGLTISVAFEISENGTALSQVQTTAEVWDQLSQADKVHANMIGKRCLEIALTL